MSVMEREQLAKCSDDDLANAIGQLHALQMATMAGAVQRATPAQIRKLEENIEGTDEVLADPAAVATLDAEFHVLIGKASGNRVLQLAREPSDLLVFPTTRLVLSQVKEGPARLLEAHRMMLDAIVRRDKEAARLWARRHRLIGTWSPSSTRSGSSPANTSGPPQLP